MKRRPKLIVIEGGRKDPLPFLMFNPFLFWFWWLK